MKININQLTPFIAIHPGEILKDELKARHIKLRDFALLSVIGLPHLREVINGRINIDASIALAISKSLNIDTYIWLNLQSNYEKDLAKIKEKNNTSSL
jgi:addiction module HigA family antidote